MILLHADWGTAALPSSEHPRPELALLQPQTLGSGGAGFAHDLRATPETIILTWPRLGPAAKAALQAFWLGSGGMAQPFGYVTSAASPLLTSDNEGGSDMFRAADGWFFPGPAPLEMAVEIPVRFAEPELRMTERPGGAVECTIVLLKEPA